MLNNESHAFSLKSMTIFKFFCDVTAASIIKLIWGKNLVEVRLFHVFQNAKW